MRACSLMPITLKNAATSRCTSTNWTWRPSVSRAVTQFSSVPAAVKSMRGEQLPKVIDTGFFWYDKSNIDSPEIQAAVKARAALMSVIDEHRAVLEESGELEDVVRGLAMAHRKFGKLASPEDKASLDQYTDVIIRQTFEKVRLAMCQAP